MTTFETNRNKLVAQIADLVQELAPKLKELEAHRTTLREVTDAEENRVRELPENADFLKLADELGAEDIFIDLENADDFSEAMEDDGTLHITKGKVRACFICNQDISKTKWNVLARPIVKAFGMKLSK